MNFDSTADDGNSLAASLWHKGGFKTRPYKLRDCDVLPVRVCGTLVICDCPDHKGERGEQTEFAPPLANHARPKPRL